MLSRDQYFDLFHLANANRQFEAIIDVPAGVTINLANLFTAYEAFEDAWARSIRALGDRTVTCVFLAEYALKLTDYIYCPNYLIGTTRACEYLKANHAVVLDFIPFPVRYKHIRRRRQQERYRAVLETCVVGHLCSHLNSLDRVLASQFDVVTAYVRLEKILATYLTNNQYTFLPAGEIHPLPTRALAFRNLAGRIQEYFGD